ncbi:hypothetical protein B0H10DRAFT_2228926 [Mycena sp. CBHHK59/15]|nr:hypothetical protein B0H10DRAFT_2228926 [Mycena sp. CBHHK59/15]
MKFNSDPDVEMSEMRIRQLRLGFGTSTEIKIMRQVLSLALSIPFRRPLSHYPANTHVTASVFSIHSQLPTVLVATILSIWTVMCSTVLNRRSPRFVLPAPHPACPSAAAKAHNSAAEAYNSVATAIAHTAAFASVSGASDDRRNDPPLNAPLPPQPPPQTPLTPLVVGVDVLEITDILRWREFVATQVQPLARDASHVHIHGKTVEAVGACIVDLLAYFQRRSDRDEPFHMEDRRLQTRQIVRCNASDMAVESFLRDCCLISLGVRLGSSTRAITQGVGPERAALRHGCTVLTQRHHYWQQVPSSRMFRPVFLPGAMALPERIKTFHAHGIFLALHCFLLQHGPQPISIWLLLALIKGKEAMLILIQK